MFRFIFAGISVFFLLALLFLIIKIWLECRMECISPSEIVGNKLPENILKKVLHPLRELAGYYEKRDVTLIDKCVDEIMLADELLILGTNPKEIFAGRERAKNLLWGDWKYWGKANIDADKTVFNRVGDIIYFVTRGTVKLDIWHFVIPIKITGLLREKDEKWYISKLQFVNDFNTNYIIFAWGASFALIVSLVIFGITCILNV